MSKFLKSTILFSLLLFGWMALNFAYNFYQVNKPVELDATTLIIGDSHLRFGINPNLLPSASNVCIGAEPLLITHYKLKRLLNDNPQIETVLIGYSYNNFSAYQDEKLWGNKAKSQYNKYYPIVPLSLPKYARVNDVKFYHTYVEKMMLYPNFDAWPFMGKFDKMDPKLAEADVDLIIERHYKVDGKVADASVISGHYLDSIIHLASQKNVELILVTTPLHPEYRKRIPAHIDRYWKEKTLELKLRGVKMLDYSELQYPDDYFHDHDHLSSVGSEKFTLELNKKITSSNN